MNKTSADLAVLLLFVLSLLCLCFSSFRRLEEEENRLFVSL